MVQHMCSTNITLSQKRLETQALWTLPVWPYTYLLVYRGTIPMVPMVHVYHTNGTRVWHTGTMSRIQYNTHCYTWFSVHSYRHHDIMDTC
jgi:hypothetical protein